MKKLKPKKPEYGYRRTWLVPYPSTCPPGVSDYGAHMRKARRLGPKLMALPVAAARVDQHDPLLQAALTHWDAASPTSNWDACQASILLSVYGELLVRPGFPLSRNEFSGHAGCIIGSRSVKHGANYAVVALVTRSNEPDLHPRQRKMLAAALRDAADLIERQPTTQAPAGSSVISEKKPKRLSRRMREMQ